VRYGQKHPDTDVKVYEIPQIPGYRHLSRANKSISESLITSGYAIPIAVFIRIWLAGCLWITWCAGDTIWFQASGDCGAE